MTPAGQLLRAEIAARGPIPFTRFMEVALYHPVHGYYRRRRDPFGKHGDFYTAEQVQPVFGMLIASVIRGLMAELQGDRTVVELGAGRAEMRDYLSEWRYVPVDAGRGGIPERFSGVLFANEFFDALPVRLVARRNGRFIERLVDWRDPRFIWTDGPEVDAGILECLSRHGAPAEDALIEVNLEAGKQLIHAARCLERGWLLAIDYGYTAREMIRFPEGTLMSYRRHQALEDVLREPGEQDITAHVNFTALQHFAADAGLETVRFESMASMLLRAGEADQFAAVLHAGSEAEAARRRMQLKLLLYGMGETFRALLLRKGKRPR